MGVHIYQIAYSEESRSTCDPGFQQLDNLSNERPDWREYWPIRNYLKSHELDEGSLYGFLSPKFGQKTGLSARAVFDFIEKHETREVFLFSPFFDQLAFFLNVFAQGEANHAGLLQLSIDFLKRSGLDADLSGMISCSRNAVFSNYFVARPSFWRQWYEVTENLFRSSEDPSDPLYSRLTATAKYREGDVQYKIFVLERIASYVLRRYGLERIKAYPLHTSVSANPATEHFFGELMILDSMKFCYLDCGNELYLELYRSLKQRIESQYWQLATRPRAA